MRTGRQGLILNCWAGRRRSEAGNRSPTRPSEGQIYQRCLWTFGGVRWHYIFSFTNVISSTLMSFMGLITSFPGLRQTSSLPVTYQTDDDHFPILLFFNFNPLLFRKQMLFLLCWLGDFYHIKSIFFLMQSKFLLYELDIVIGFALPNSYYKNICSYFPCTFMVFFILKSFDWIVSPKTQILKP